MQYRKKPIVVDAIRYNGLNKEEVESFVGKTLRSELNSIAYDAGAKVPPILSLFINTRSGEMEVKPGDYVIRGVGGEFHPCKPDVFQNIYEEVSSLASYQNITSEMVVGLGEQDVSAEASLETPSKRLIYDMSWKAGYDWAKEKGAAGFYFDLHTIRNAHIYAKKLCADANDEKQSLVFNTRIFGFILGAADYIRNKHYEV